MPCGLFRKNPRLPIAASAYRSIATSVQMRARAPSLDAFPRVTSTSANPTNAKPLIGPAGFTVARIILEPIVTSVA